MWARRADLDHFDPVIGLNRDLLGLPAADDVANGLQGFGSCVEDLVEANRNDYDYRDEACDQDHRNGPVGGRERGFEPGKLQLDSATDFSAFDDGGVLGGHGPIVADQPQPPEVPQE